jgi:hypothetical protein
MEKPIDENSIWRENHSGFSVLTVMVAIGFLGVVAAMIGQVSSSALGDNNKMSLKQDIEEMRNFIRSEFNCENTKDSMPRSCRENVGRAPIQIRNKFDHVIVTNEIKTATIRGDYVITGSCDYKGPNSGSIVIEYALKKADPTRRQRADLFAGIPLACSY